MAKALEFRKKSKEEVLDLVKDLEVKVDAIRFGGARQKRKNVKELQALRKDIARAYTVLNEK